jgi:hypothetical protein
LRRSRIRKVLVSCNVRSAARWRWSGERLSRKFVAAFAKVSVAGAAAARPSCPRRWAGRAGEEAEEDNCRGTNIDLAFTHSSETILSDLANQRLKARIDRHDWKNASGWFSWSPQLRFHFGQPVRYDDDSSVVRLARHERAVRVRVDVDPCSAFADQDRVLTRDADR